MVLKGYHLCDLLKKLVPISLFCLYFFKQSDLLITQRYLSLIGLKVNNNWAVIVSTSRYWYNYRHNTNALAYYNFLKKNGFQDDNIILMLAEDIPCNPRNTLPGGVYSEKDNLFYNINSIIGIEECATVDYKEDDVTVTNLIRVLTGKHDYYTPNRKRLLTNENSNIFIFLTGHGGDGFLKFQDFEEINSLEISNSIAEMQIQRRYKRIFIITETCQASTLHREIISDEVYAIGCSSLGESSYSKHSKHEIGVATIDRFTHHTLKDLERMGKGKKLSILNFVSMYPRAIINSTPQLIYNPGKSDINKVYINQFLFSENVRVHSFNLADLDLEEVVYETLEINDKEMNDIVECSIFREIFSINNYKKSNLSILSKCLYKDSIIGAIEASPYKKVDLFITKPKESIKNLSNVDIYLSIFSVLVSIFLGYYSYVF
ncbi:glycosyl transferase [Cryptosporidium ryanae]|uniref:glycosyl transferase n=1 Tax=Cryptosporidium ryanae TaxID=515981 RepID=UPI00351A2E1D|nr:glycosyl transferase [Cryptosporidium ryanae]